jgi:hypothetical protein
MIKQYELKFLTARDRNSQATHLLSGNTLAMSHHRRQVASLKKIKFTDATSTRRNVAMQTTHSRTKIA